MKLVCCCLSQVINNLFHLITTLRCSNIDQDSQPNTHTPNPPNAPTHTHQGKRKKGKGKIGKGGEEGKGNPHHTTPRTTKHPLTIQAHTTHHTDTTHKGKEGKGKGKRGSLCVWC